MAVNGAGQPPPTPPDDAIAPRDNPPGDTHLSSAAAAPPAIASPADTTAPASSFETPPRRVFDWGATLPQRGRLLGIDYGSKRLGVAVSNLDQTLASPVSNRDRTDIEQDARFFRRQVAEYGAVGIVVGLPVHLSGDEGQKARESRQFGAWLAQVCQVPVRFHDERFSTRFADEQLRDAGLKASQRQGRRDMLAAQYLLQAYLESRASAGEAPAGLRS
ncbi:MAG: Holliday junction resolvase RuvX [Planctomycetaceae bacterium]